MKLDGSKAAVITGGAKGFGLALAQRLVAQGVRVALGDLDEQAGAAAASAINEQ
ncbi:hypothetical protein THASP1DRAFT_33825 [Thamnocephalis sphaerospora]|uniref:Uncharacterized protein n=1 Tax=Thamnocephalis sphaerospora TaxID=78915 RepID=A0A4P9XFN7_9FUNG|nr:hypothetical protein THASP1DRAFT_33825 [Thamnocephalis sphaerospora]|eukprot:RKP04413.1 hypothetical protein THASP1DRAFT_33825 [Thamnocephalis sphaerospora]